MPRAFSAPGFCTGLPFRHAAERDHRREAGRLHAGDPAQPVHQPAVDGAALRLVVAREARVDRRERLPLVAVARVGLPGLHRAAREQAGGGQQGQRQRDLGGDEQVAGREPAQALPRVLAGLLLELGHDARARQLPRRPETEHGGAQHAEGQRRTEHAKVGGPVEGERHRRERQQRRHEQVDRPVTEQQAERAADERQHHPLGQQLLHDPDAAAAEREAHGDFLPPRRAAGQHHVGEVQARDDEDDHRHPDQHGEHSAHVAIVLRARGDRRARQLLHREQLVLVLGRVGALELGGQLPERRRRRLGRQARFQAAHQDERLAAPVRHRRRGRVVAHEIVFDELVRADWHPDLGGCQGGRSSEAARRDPDDRERAAVDADRPAQETDVAAVTLPVRVADDGDSGSASGALLLFGERAAGQQVNAERGEVVPSHRRAERAARGVGLPDADKRHREPHDAAETAVVVPNVDVARVRESAIPIGPGVVVAVDPDDLARALAARQRSEEERVDQREDRGVRADAQGEHQDGRQREPRVLEQETEAVARVLEQVRHGSPLGPARATLRMVTHGGAARFPPSPRQG